MYALFVFFFKQKTAYEMRISDWSSDVCSSDLRIFLRSVQASWGVLAIASKFWQIRSHEHACYSSPAWPASGGADDCHPRLRPAGGAAGHSGPHRDPAAESGRAVEHGRRRGGAAVAWPAARKSVVWGKRVSVRGDLGGGGYI